MDSFLIVFIVTYFILSFQVCSVKFLSRILLGITTHELWAGHDVKLKVLHLHFSISGFLLSWSQFLRLFFFLWKSGRRRWEPWLALLPQLGPSRTFVRNLFSHLDVQEEIRPRPTDYVLWKWRVSAWSADRGLGLIIPRLPADSLPKWNCNSGHFSSSGPAGQARLFGWHLQFGETMVRIVF